MNSIVSVNFEVKEDVDSKRQREYYDLVVRALEAFNNPGEHVITDEERTMVKRMMNDCYGS